MSDLMAMLEEGEDLPAEYDPPKDKRVYYRNTTTGDRGYVVRRGGHDVIRLDRPNEEIIRPLHPTTWKLDKEHRPLTQMQIAQVAFDADKRLCFFLGEHEEARKEWLDLKDKERIKWMRQGPPSNPRIRHVQWKAIMHTLQPIAS